MKEWTAAGLVLALAAAVTVTAVAYPRVWNGNRSAGKNWTDEWKYTEADYQMALGLKSAGYEKMSVGEFDKLVADYGDEEAFHQREKPLQRLKSSYSWDKADSQFVHLTLTAAFDASAIKHYGGYCTSMRPSFSDEVGRVREEDVFGDKYPVFEAEMSYSITYEVPDESKLTVGERDGLILSYRAAVQKFLDGKTEKELLNDEEMEKLLTAELARLDKSLSSGKMTLLGTSLDYYYAYDESGEYTTAQAG